MSEKPWGGYRHGRKRRSSILVKALHTRVYAGTHAALVAKAEEKGITIGQLIDQLVRNAEQPQK